MAEYIEREAAENAFCKYMGFTSGRVALASELIFAKIPAADVTPVKHGKWIEKIDPWDRQHIGKCSECGKSYRDYMYFRFCPNCGAKMDGETNG